MKFRQIIPAAVLMLVIAGLPPAAARADTVLYDSATLIEGQQSFVQAFNITTPGTLTVTLANIPWLDTISNLTCFLTSATGMLGTTTGSGSETIDIGAGTIYAHWFGDAQGTYNIGVLGIKISFQPSNVTPVPLPGTLVLFLSGLGLLLFGRTLRRAMPGDAGLLPQC